MLATAPSSSRCTTTTQHSPRAAAVPFHLPLPPSIPFTFRLYYETRTIAVYRMQQGLTTTPANVPSCRPPAFPNLLRSSVPAGLPPPAEPLPAAPRLRRGGLLARHLRAQGKREGPLRRACSACPRNAGVRWGKKIRAHKHTQTHTHTRHQVRNSYRTVKDSDQISHPPHIPPPRFPQSNH